MECRIIDSDNQPTIITPNPIGGVLIECLDKDDGQTNHTIHLDAVQLEFFINALELMRR